MIARIKHQLLRFLVYEKRPSRFAAACSIAIYVAFSPFLGLHTAMIIVISWLFRLNFPIMLAVTLLINNPWSMVPIYGIDYFFGQWLLELLAINHYAYNPAWITMINERLVMALGHGNISLLAFLVGGNLLGLLFALIAYPLIKYMAVSLQLTSNSLGARTISKAATPSFKPSHSVHLSRTQYETGSPK